MSRKKPNKRQRAHGPQEFSHEERVNNRAFSVEEGYLADDEQKPARKRRRRSRVYDRLESPSLEPFKPAKRPETQARQVTDEPVINPANPSPEPQTESEHEVAEIAEHTARMRPSPEPKLEPQPKLEADEPAEGVSQSPQLEPPKPTKPPKKKRANGKKYEENNVIDPDFDYNELISAIRVVDATKFAGTVPIRKRFPGVNFKAGKKVFEITLNDIVTHTMRLMLGISHDAKGLTVTGDGLLEKDAAFTKGTAGAKISIGGYDRYQMVWDDESQDRVVLERCAQTVVKHHPQYRKSMGKIEHVRRLCLEFYKRSSTQSRPDYVAKHTRKMQVDRIRKRREALVNAMRHWFDVSPFASCAETGLLRAIVFETRALFPDLIAQGEWPAFDPVRPLYTDGADGFVVRPKKWPCDKIGDLFLFYMIWVTLAMDRDSKPSDMEPLPRFAIPRVYWDTQLPVRKKGSDKGKVFPFMVEDGELANCERAEPVELDKMSIFDIAREAEGSKAYFPASKEGRRSHKLLRNAYRHFRDVTDMDVKDGDHLAAGFGASPGARPVGT